MKKRNVDSDSPNESPYGGFAVGRRALLRGLAAGAGMLAAQAFALPASDAEPPLALPQGIAGMAVTVIEPGQPDRFAFAGRASLAFDRAVTERTLFHIGSVGKHVTAAALLRLAEAGKLDLDAPMGRYVPGLVNGWERPTLAQTLSHIGGYPPDFPGVELDRPIGVVMMPDYARRLGLMAAPGRVWAYSNVGYVLLGYVIEAVTGTSYGDHVTATLFRANGLADSRADDGEAVIPGKAEPVLWQDGAFRRTVQMSSAVSSVAAGGLLMSPRDAARWERALAGDTLLSARSKALMGTAARTTSGRSTGYGMGWWIREDRAGRPVHLHTGSVPGFRTFYLRHPGQARAVVMMLAGETRMMGLGLAEAARHWPDATPFSARPIADTAPDLTRALFDVLLYKAAPATDRLAPELAELPAALLEEELHPLSRAEAAAITASHLVEDRRSPRDRQRTYRISTPTREIMLIAGYTPEGRLYRIG